MILQKLHDAQETFSIINKVESSFDASYFYGNCDAFLFQESLMNRKIERTA